MTKLHLLNKAIDKLESAKARIRDGDEPSILAEEDVSSGVFSVLAALDLLEKEDYRYRHSVCNDCGFDSILGRWL